MKKLIPLALLALTLTGCAGGFIKSQVESGIKHALPQYIGPAKAYTVHVDGSGTDMIDGLIKHLHIEGTDVQIDPKMLLSQITIDMDDVRYNDDRQLTSVRNTLFKASVNESTVNRLIPAALIKEYKVKLKLVNNQVQVNGTREVMGIDMPLSITGKPQIAPGNKIDFVADTASAAYVPVPAALANKILQKLNPILDMSVMKFPVVLQEIDVKDGCVNISGRAEMKFKENKAKT